MVPTAEYFHVPALMLGAAFTSAVLGEIAGQATSERRRQLNDKTGLPLQKPSKTVGHIRGPLSSPLIFPQLPPNSFRALFPLLFPPLLPIHFSSVFISSFLHKSAKQKGTMQFIGMERSLLAVITFLRNFDSIVRSIDTKPDHSLQMHWQKTV